MTDISSDADSLDHFLNDMDSSTPSEEYVKVPQLALIDNDEYPRERDSCAAHQNKWRSNKSRSYPTRSTTIRLPSREAENAKKFTSDVNCKCNCFVQEKPIYSEQQKPQPESVSGSEKTSKSPLSEESLKSIHKNLQKTMSLISEGHDFSDRQMTASTAIGRFQTSPLITPTEEGDRRDGDIARDIIPFLQDIKKSLQLSDTLLSDTLTDTKNMHKRLNNIKLSAGDDAAYRQNYSYIPKGVYQPPQIVPDEVNGSLLKDKINYFFQRLSDTESQLNIERTPKEDCVSCKPSKKKSRALSGCRYNQNYQLEEFSMPVNTEKPSRSTQQPCPCHTDHTESAFVETTTPQLSKPKKKVQIAQQPVVDEHSLPPPSSLSQFQHNLYETYEKIFGLNAALGRIFQSHKTNLDKVNSIQEKFSSVHKEVERIMIEAKTQAEVNQNIIKGVEQAMVMYDEKVEAIESAFAKTT